MGGEAQVGEGRRAGGPGRVRDGESEEDRHSRAFGRRDAAYSRLSRKVRQFSLCSGPVWVISMVQLGCGLVRTEGVALPRSTEGKKARKDGMARKEEAIYATAIGSLYQNSIGSLS
jgi:hypothetical protein